MTRPVAVDLLDRGHCFVDVVNRQQSLARREMAGESGVLRAEVHRRYDSRGWPELVEWMTRSTFFSWDITDYLDLYKTVDMVVGCRFHGNLLALANGVPAYYLTYDRRTEELVDLLQLPSQKLGSLDPDFDPYDADWSATEAMYIRLRARMIRFLEGNGLAHRLGPRVPPVPGQVSVPTAA